MRLFPVISLLLWSMHHLAAAQPAAAPTLFDPATYQGLVSDHKARKVGDALTVLVQESATASSSVDSNATRNADVALRGQAIGQKQRGLDIGVGANNDGGGQTVRSGRVAAQITVTVQAVEPNGELLVAGQQTVDLNGEKQVISVAGRVRPKDVLDNNAVLSSRLADARISYNGEGYIAEKSRPGVLSRVLHFLGL